MLKKLSTFLTFLLAFSFSVTLLGNESATKYFPSTLGSYWVYEDQDGNELARRAVEGEEIAGKTYPAFSYEPELKDWAEYSPFIRPFLYNISDAGIILVVGDEREKAVKARLKKEMDILFNALEGDNTRPNADIDVDIEARGQDLLFFLPAAITVDEEWDANQLEAKVKMTYEDENIPEGKQMTIDFTIIEIGVIHGKETVETAAGKFEDCLKVEYRTETTGVINPTPTPAGDPSGETVTTVWFAPNVGIVKFYQEMRYTFLEMIPDDEGISLPADPKPKTFELKKYEIKSDAAEGE